MGVLKTLIGLIIASALIGGAFHYQQRQFGTGPRVSVGAPVGDTVEVAFVANAIAGTISVIDVSSRQVLGTIDAKPDGANVGFFRDPEQWAAQSVIEARAGLNYAQDTDLSRDGTVLFISRGYLADVVAMDIATGDILWRTPIAGVRADHMDISPDGVTLFVSAVIRGGNVVEAFDTATGSKLGAIQAGDWPHDVHVTPDGERVYIASLGDMQLDLEERDALSSSYKVTIASATSFEVLSELSFEAGVRPFQVTEDQTRLYAQLSNAHAIIARDLQTGQLTARIDLPVSEGVTEEDWDFEAPHHGLALTPDESLLCVAGRASDYAAIISTPDFETEETIEVGDAPSWASVSGDGRYCLLPNTRSDDVSIVDLESRREVARLAVGRGPKHITMGRIPATVAALLK